jgi:hypothetical protein
VPTTITLGRAFGAVLGKGVAFGLGAWALLVVGCFSILTLHAMAPGTNAEAPQKMSLNGERNKPTLLVFAHPQCPCSRATISELDRLWLLCKNRVKVEVYVLAPADQPSEWAKGPLWKQACEIPGIEVKLDKNGAMASQYRVHTSGQTLLYSADGKLLFSGGITASRGHEGDNAGRDAIVSLVNGGKSAVSNTAVYGCALFAR